MQGLGMHPQNHKINKLALISPFPISISCCLFLLSIYHYEKACTYCPSPLSENTDLCLNHKNLQRCYDTRFSISTLMNVVSHRYANCAKWQKNTFWIMHSILFHKGLIGIHTEHLLQFRILVPDKNPLVKRRTYWCELLRI
jgi:hypothetical protein